MDLKKLYFEEVNLIKKERIKRIIEAAKIEFAENGIVNTKISSIAKTAKVGEATLYRYFQDKFNLVKLIALDYWNYENKLLQEFFETNILEKDTGLAKVKAFLDIFIELYHNHKNFLKFVEDFDNYMMSSNEEDKDSGISELISEISKSFIDIYNEGIKDGSICDTHSAEEMYRFISQVMVSTTQKLAFRVGYYHVDNPVYPIECLNSTIDMFLEYIKCKKA